MNVKAIPKALSSILGVGGSSDQNQDGVILTLIMVLFCITLISIISVRR